MDDETTAPGTGRQLVEGESHDHAWRRVRSSSSYSPVLVGQYVCDLCAATWEL